MLLLPGRCHLAYRSAYNAFFKGLLQLLVSPLCPTHVSIWQLHVMASFFNRNHPYISLMSRTQRRALVGPWRMHCKYQKAPLELKKHWTVKKSSPNLSRYCLNNQSCNQSVSSKLRNIKFRSIFLNAFQVNLKAWFTWPILSHLQLMSNIIHAYSFLIPTMNH